MINAIVGRPRSGKSYESVAFHILPAVQSGRKVITNIPLNLDHFAAVYGPECLELIDVRGFDFAAYGSKRPFSTPDEYSDDWRNEKGQGPLYIVDEAHLCLPKGRTDDDILEWYSMHGHYGVDVLLLTQNLRKVHRDIQDMVELVYYCGKLTVLGLENQYSRKVKAGLKGEVLNETRRTYKPEYFPFYKSHTQSKDAVSEAVAQDIVPIWKHWTFKGALLMFVLAGSIIFFGTGEKKVDKPVVKPVQKKVTFARNTQLVKAKKVDPVKKKGVDPEVVEADPEPVPLIEHPFDKVSLHVAGILRGATRSIALFKASQNEQLVFQLTSKNLIEAGYSVNIVTDCLVVLSYGDYSEHVTCNLPTVGPSGRRS